MAPGAVTAEERASRAPRPAAPSRGAPPRPSHRRVALRKVALPLLLIAPAFVVIGALVGYPLGRTFYLSFTDTDLADLVEGTSSWVGLDKYREIFSTPELREALLNTVTFGVACVAGTIALGVAVALVLNQRFHGRAVLAVIVLLPWAVPAIAAGAVWQWLFNDQNGLVNWALVQLGASSFETYSWFTETGPAFFVLWLMVVWQSFPFVALAVLAGLQTIPREVLEAAEVDGATSAQRFRHIVLPLLKPILAVLVVISTIWDFKIFDQIWVNTENGQIRVLDTAAIVSYRSLRTNDYGLGAAIAVVLFVALLAVTLLYARRMRREVDA